MASVRRADHSPGGSTSTPNQSSIRESNIGRRRSSDRSNDEQAIEAHELSTMNGTAGSSGLRQRERISQEESTGHEGPPASLTDRISEDSGSQFTAHAGLRNSYRDVPRPLNWQDVAALIINKMVGTGIYTTPPAVLLMTRSKGEALGLWIVGFGYSLISMAIYLEFARRLPHTGGELIYLDETLPRPRLLIYTMYTFYMTFVYNTSTNSMEFAEQVLTCTAGDILNPTPNPQALRFIAVVALSFFCLLHYFSGRVGRDLNQVLALIKIIMLLIFFIAGCIRAAHHFTPDWKRNPNQDVSSSATAFLYILFSFSGWENATYVGGEIKDHATLRKGFIIAVLMVGAFYLLINLVFLLAVPYSAVNLVTDYVALFFGGGYKARLTWAILIAFSSAGSLLANIYTNARVKQVIGKSNILPWSRIWRANSPPRVDDYGNVIALPTPQGGLILHWVSSVVFIIVTCRITNISEAIEFPGALQSYAAGWIGIFISIGFPFLFLRPESPIFWPFTFFDKTVRLTPREIPPPIRDRSRLPSVGEHIRDSHPLEQTTATRWVQILGKTYWLFAFAYLVLNAWIVIVPLVPPFTDGNGNKLQVQGWLYIVIVACVYVCAILYYLATFSRAPVRTLARRASHNQIVEDVKQRPNRQPSIMNIAGVHPEIIEDEYNDPQYGNRRSIQVVVDSQVESSRLYFLFGGSDPTHAGTLGISDLWDRVVARREPREGT